jgi:hypothetical protein
MNTHLHQLSEKTKRLITLALIVVLGVSSVSAGFLITMGDGITPTTGNVIKYEGNSSVAPTTLDGLLAFSPNGITGPTIPGISTTGLEGVTYSVLNLIQAIGVDSASTGQASAITATGLNGLIINSGGNSYQADSVFIQRADGITFNGIDNLSIFGPEGITFNGIDGASILHANGITFNGIDGLLAINGAEGITFNGIDGQTITIPPGDLTILGADSGTASDVSNIIFSGADRILQFVNGILTSATGVQLPPLPTSGVQSVDAALVKLIDGLADDSSVNAAVVYYNPVTAADITTLRQLGVLLGQRYHILPLVTVTATKQQIIQISQLPTVRAIYSNRSVKILAEPGNGLTGTERVKTVRTETCRDESSGMSRPWARPGWASTLLIQSLSRDCPTQIRSPDTARSSGE